MNKNSARSASRLLFMAVLIQLFCPAAFADFDCQLVAPPGVTKTAQGSAQAQIAANTLLKVVKAGGDVSASGKTTFETAQQNAPGEDPDALKAKTLYIFCGMVANATDITTERKFAMLKELQQIPPPPPPPPAANPPVAPAQPASNGDDIPSKFGLPALGATQDQVAGFALSKHAVWRSADDGSGPFAMFDSELHDHPATVRLFMRGSKMSAVSWVMEGWRRDNRTGHGPIARTGDGQDPSDICDSSFIDGLTDFFVRAAGVTVNKVSDAHLQPLYYDVWGSWGTPQMADLCYRPSTRCDSKTHIEKHYVGLKNDSQDVDINTVYHMSTYSWFSNDPDIIELHHHEGCTLKIVITRDGD